MQDKRKQDQLDQSRAGSKPQDRRIDQGKVGQDTDGDGKVVKPGQKPGQSHGHGLDENK
jgi:hypothetical protein